MALFFHCQTNFDSGEARGQRNPTGEVPTDQEIGTDRGRDGQPVVAQPIASDTNHRSFSRRTEGGQCCRHREIDHPKPPGVSGKNPTRFASPKTNTAVWGATSAPAMERNTHNFDPEGGDDNPERQPRTRPVVLFEEQPGDLRIGPHRTDGQYGAKDRQRKPAVIQ
jgi:hypothetical protein